MNLNNIREGELKNVFDALEEAFKEKKVDFYLIGAIARDIWYARGDQNFLPPSLISLFVLIMNILTKINQNGYNIHHL